MYKLTTDLQGEYDEILDRVMDQPDRFGEAMFWGFCKLRQNAWARRASGLPGPWTADPIIAHWRFTNLYRELDRGTLFTAENVLENSKNGREAMRAAAFYRCFNRPETWELLARFLDVNIENLPTIIGMITTSKTPNDELYEFFNTYHGKSKDRLFTGAYQMTSMVKMFYDKTLHHLWDACDYAMKQENLRDATLAMFATPYLGMFSAFQVTMDINIPVAANEGRPWFRHMGKHDVLDEWVAIGPGSKAGSALVRSDLPPLTVVKYLRENQYMQMARLGGDPFPMPICNGSPLPLRMIDIEHSLCEYAKYRNALDKGRMKSKLATVAKTTMWTPSGLTPPGWRYK